MNKLNSDFDPADHCGNCIDAKRSARRDDIIVAGGLAIAAVLATVSHFVTPNPYPNAERPAPRPRMPATAAPHPVSPEVAAAQRLIIESVTATIVQATAQGVLEVVDELEGN